MSSINFFRKKVMKTIKQILSKNFIENETDDSVGLLEADLEILNPFLAYGKGEYCVFNEKMGGYHTNERLMKKMLARAEQAEYVDISDPYLYVKGTLDVDLNFKSLIKTNPFPNGLFMALMNFRKLNQPATNSPVTCLEFFQVQDELRIGLFHFYDNLKSHNRRDLTLEADYSILEDGSLKEKYIFSPTEKEYTRLLFNTYLKKFLVYSKIHSEPQVYRNLIISSNLVTI